MNLTRLSTTAGVDYLLNTVAPGDGRAPAKDGGLTAYYAEAGTPPGRWWGRGASAAHISSAETITAEGANRLFKDFAHPATGQALGAKPRASGATAGFDLTFTIPKAISALWAVAPAHVQDVILAAHQQAISEALTYVEDRVLQTRSGAGGVATVKTLGMIAGWFDHFDSREGDPHLHTHVVVSNRVQRASDGKWLTVDSRALHKAAVSVSELHQNLLLDELHRSLGMEFYERAATTTKAVVPDVVGVPDALSAVFSTRDRQIRHHEAEMIAAWAKEHEGQLPRGKDLARIHQAVWRATRKPKAAAPTPLSQLRATWRGQVKDAGVDVDQVLAQVLDRGTLPDVQPGAASALAADYAVLTLEGFAQTHAPTVLNQVRTSRATWTVANLRAEAERLTRNVRCASASERRALVDAVVEAAASISVELSHQRYELTPAAAVDVRLALRGRSIFDDEHARVFTDTSILQAEQYLFDLATNTTGPHVEDEVAAAEISRASTKQVTARGFGFAPDQRSAAKAVVTDARALSAIIGPAGTGKSTTMKAVKAAWQSTYGPGSVVGLTTSAQAAAVLSEEISTEAYTVAKWLYETVGEGGRRRAEQLRDLQQVLDSPDAAPARRAHARRAIAPLLARAQQWTMRKGQLLIIDEASMTGTHALAELARQAQTAGAKVLLVGDPAQLDAPDAGGMLGWLARTGNAQTLESVWRFSNDWEKSASLSLREGNSSVIDIYNEAGRIRHGQDEAMLEESFLATRADQRAGKSTILIAATNAVAADLNQRFTLERRASGEVSIDTLTRLRDGTNAGVGDVLLARTVDRRLRDGAGDFIRNGTQLTLTSISDDVVTAVRSDNGASIVLPKAWVAAHVELGYAITAHRAQGTTVDAGHVAIPSESALTRELLYVAMTRGRESNTAWVGEPDADDRHDQLLPAAEAPQWQEILTNILTTTGTERAAHEVREQLHEEYHSLSHLQAERAHLLTLAHAHSATLESTAFHEMLTSHLGPQLTQQITKSPKYSALAGEFARLRSRGVNPSEVLEHTASARELSTAKDAAAVLLWRAEEWHDHALPSDVDHVAERTLDVGDPALRRALDQSAALIDARIEQLIRDAPAQPWALDLAQPSSGAEQSARHSALRAIAIYRDTYTITGPNPLGPPPHDAERIRLRQWQRAHRLLAQAQTSAPEPATASITGPISTANHVARGPAL